MYNNKVEQNLPFGKRSVVKSYALWLRDDRFFLSDRNKLAQNIDAIGVSLDMREDVAKFTVINDRTYPQSFIEALTYLVFDLQELSLNDLTPEHQQLVQDYYNQNYI